MSKKPTYAELAQKVLQLEHRLHALQAHEDAAKNIHQLLKFAPYGMFLIDLTGKVIFANELGAKRLGTASEKIIGSLLRDYSPPEISEKRRLKGMEAIQSRKPVKFEDRVGDRWYDNMICPVFGEDGAITHMAIYGADITERKSFEQALQQSEEKYRLLVENANDAIFIAQDGVLRFANPMTEKLSGYSAAELSLMPFVDLIHPDDKEMVSENHRRRLQGEAVPTTYPFRIIDRTGRELCLQQSEVMITWEGRPASLNFLRDITEQRKLEAQFQAAQRLESLGTLAGGLAHDFNNLLMGIQGRTSLMLIDIDASHPHFEHLQAIEDHVKSAADLTKQLLGFARGGKYESVPSDLNGIVRKTSSMFARTKKEIKVFEDYQDSLWTVEVDQGQIQQVLMNLYVNAWQAMPGGGSLVLETRNVDLDQEFVKPFGIHPGRYVRISVTDTGIGMDEKTKGRLFEPFFTTKGMGRGTGLGLASVYGIVKNHGGVISVFSEKGKGSTFTIYLPASDSPVRKSKTTEDVLQEGHETILLVDDEDSVLDVGRQMLEKLGYNVFTAREGAEAVACYESHPGRIDLVLLDLIMPGMKGSLVFEKLRQINPGVKVMVSSGYGADRQAQEMLSRGCKGFIQKPFDLRTLSRRLREILDSQA